MSGVSTNGYGDTPYDEMRELLSELNQGKKRGEKWVVKNQNDPRCILAMATGNDPFYCGQPAQLEQAQWFADLHERCGFSNKRTHLRFLHYVASGEEKNPITGEFETAKKPDGSDYENTDENWSFIVTASKFARHLGLVDPHLIVDRKTPRPHFFAPREPAPEPRSYVREAYLRFPKIDVNDLSAHLDPTYIGATGYEYTHAHEPSLVEVWVEKNLDSDPDAPVIENLCRELGVNLVTGVGFMTITSMHQLLERRAALGKPLRLLYMSDFDPAGDFMPNSPARHIEFAIRNMNPVPDIRLMHLALTHRQVKEKGLPPMPIKESDKRKDGFLEKYGVEGATELNALLSEAHAEDFERMLRRTILSLRDGTLPQRLRQARSEANSRLRQEVGRRLHWPHKAFALIEAEADEIAARYTSLIEELSEQLEEELAPLKERYERVQHAMPRRLAGLDEMELPEVEGVEDEWAAVGWLFDSRREYFTQMRSYKDVV